MESIATREKILYVAAKLFAHDGVENVSMRKIAKVIGIKSASIYYHFPSKSDVLKSCYAFYAEQQRLAAPTLESLLRLAETGSLQDVLEKFAYRFPPEHTEALNHILTIAAHRAGLGNGDDHFIREHFFSFFQSLWVPLLKRLIDLGKIEPIDVDTFVWLLTNFAFAAASLDNSSFKTGPEQWNNCLGMAFSLLKPIPSMKPETSAQPRGDHG